MTYSGSVTPSTATTPRRERLGGDQRLSGRLARPSRRNGRFGGNDLEQRCLELDNPAPSPRAMSQRPTSPSPPVNWFIVGIGAHHGGPPLPISGNISGKADVVLGGNAVNGAGGAGTLFLSGSNAWAGTTMIDGNGTSARLYAALPAATDVIFGAADAPRRLDLNGFSQTINSLSAWAAPRRGDHQQGVQPATLTINGGVTPKSAFNGSITGESACSRPAPVA